MQTPMGYVPISNRYLLKLHPAFVEVICCNNIINTIKVHTGVAANKLEECAKRWIDKFEHVNAFSMCGHSAYSIDVERFDD
jgi:hypothetical protein